MAVRRLDLIITSNAQAAIRGFASLEGAAKKVENRFGKLGRAMFNVGLIGTAAFATFTAKSVKAFIDFDDAMTRSTAILDNLSGPTRKRLEEAAKSIARVTTFSATEAAEAFYGLFSAGLDAEQSISALPVVAQFAQAALMDMGQATDYLVNAQASLGLSMEDPIANMKQMQRVADVLTETNNLATGTVEEFAEALTHKAGGALKTVGKDIEEGAAALAYLAEQGIRGSRAGESLAIFIRDVSRAAGNPSFKGAFRKFGIEVFDASGNLKNLADVVAEFETALGPMSDKQRAVTLEQLGLTRTVGDVIRQLMGGSDAIRGYEFALRGAGGATQRVADKQMESLKSKLEVLKNRFEVLMIDFGEPIAIWLVDTFVPWAEQHLLPVLKDTSTVVRDDLAPAFETMGKALDNPNVAKSLIALTSFLVTLHAAEKGAAVLAAVFGPLGRVLAYLITPIRSLGLLFTWVQIKLLPLVPILKFFGGVIAAVGLTLLNFGAFITSFVGQLGVGLVAGIVLIIRFRNTIAKWFTSAWQAVYDHFFGPIIRFFTGPFIDFWKAVWDKIEGPLRVFLRVLQVIFSVALGIVLAPFIIATGIIVAIVRQLIKFFDTNWPAIWNVISKTWEAIVTLTSYVWGEVIWPRIKKAWDLISNYVIFNVKLIIGIIRTNWQIAWAVTKAIWGFISDLIFGVWHNLRDRVFKPFALVFEALILPKLQSFWRGAMVIWGGLKTGFNAAWGWIRDNVLSPLALYFEATIMPKLRGFRDFMGRIWSQIKETAGAAWRGIVSAIKTPVNAIIRIINSLISGMNAVINLINKIPGVDIPEIPSIPLIGGGGSNAPVAQALNLNPGMAGVARNAMGTYDLAKRGPFRTNGPRAIVGEGDSRFPEYVIPTDPRFRGRANMLFAGLANDLGIGMQFGGIIDGVKNGIGNAIEAAGGLLENISRGALKAAFTPFNEAAKRGLNALPDAFRLRSIAQGFRELIWQVVTGADGGFPEESTFGGLAGGFTGAGLGGDRAANRRLGQALNAARGWAFQWAALDALVMSESGWNNNAQNPTSTAYGIGQFLNSTWAGVGYRKTSDPRTQILAMLDYIAQRYGSPNAAWAFKRSHNWYRMGGLLPYGGMDAVSLARGAYRIPVDNFPANLHRGEMVLDRRNATALRAAAESGRGPNVHIENLHIHVDGAGSMEDTRRKAREASKAFLGVLEERRVLTDSRIS